MSLVESLCQQMPEAVAQASRFKVWFDSNRIRTWGDQDISPLEGLYFPHNGLGVPLEVVEDACIRAATNPLLVGGALVEALQRYEAHATYQSVVAPVIPDEAVGLQPFIHAGHHFLAVANEARDEVVILVDPQNATA